MTTVYGANWLQPASCQATPFGGCRYGNLTQNTSRATSRISATAQEVFPYAGGTTAALYLQRFVSDEILLGTL